MKTISAPGHQRNGFVKIHAFKHLASVHHLSSCMNCHKTIAVITVRAHSFHNFKYCARLKNFGCRASFTPLIFIYIFLKTPACCFLMTFGGVEAPCLNFVCITTQSVTDQQARRITKNL